MSYQKHCPGCFRRKDGNPVCAHCGYDESAPRSPLFLPHGSVLAGQYRVGKVLGRPGGFGITYLGWDIYLQQRVAIKEFLPPEMAARVPDALHITVHTAEDRKSFDAGKDQFLREARIVARLDHTNVVRVRAFFNANDTAYMVMDYYEGMSLDAYFGQVKPTLEMGVASSLVQMILDGLSYVHERGVVHRDVKPHNIYLAAIGKPILLDFGAARKSVGASHRSISVVLTEGYAPLEQYQRHGVQGPWTDIYGTGATLYRMVAGRAPPVAIDRLQRDPLETDDFAGIPDALKPVLRKALALQVEDRYQTAAEFKAALAGALGAASQSAPAISSGLAEMAREIPAAVANGSLSASDLLPETTRRSPKVRIVSHADRAASAPAPELLPSPAASPEAAIRTQSTTVPRALMLRWALPLAIAAMVVAVIVGLKPFQPQKPRPATEAVAIDQEPLPVSEPGVQVAGTRRARFKLDGLPTLPESTVPQLRSIPAGAYARAGATTLQVPAFRMSETEITLKDFEVFAERTGYQNEAWAAQPCEGALVPGATWQNTGYPQTASHPVVCVNLEDASAYAAWLAQETTRHFRLPTEAEWEYAAAAGSASNYWWGNQVDEDHAACADCGRSSASPSKPFIVTSLGQNAFGLYGTAGNVREWTCSPATAAPLAQACVLDSAAGPRLVRGGSWHDPSIALATTYRTTAEKGTRNTWTGFRIVEDLNR